MHLHYFFRVAHADGTGWQLLIFILDRSDHLIDTDPQGFHFCRFDVDIDLPFYATNEGHRANATDIFQPLLDDLI